jgi:hypothetical protein
MGGVSEFAGEAHIFRRAANFKSSATKDRRLASRGRPH